jgi:hypothetical protein
MKHAFGPISHWRASEEDVLTCRRLNSSWNPQLERAHLERAEDLFRLACPTQYNLHASFDAVHQIYTRFGKDLSGLVGMTRRPMHLIGLPNFDSCSFSAIQCHERDSLAFFV